MPEAGRRQTIWSASRVTFANPDRVIQRMLEEATRQYAEDFPAAREAELFICVRDSSTTSLPYLGGFQVIEAFPGLLGRRHFC